jgi:hypothetical protein
VEEEERGALAFGMKEEGEEMKEEGEEMKERSVRP